MAYVNKGDDDVAKIFAESKSDISIATFFTRECKLKLNADENSILNSLVLPRNNSILCQWKQDNRKSQVLKAKSLHCTVFLTALPQLSVVLCCNSILLVS